MMEQWEDAKISFDRAIEKDKGVGEYYYNRANVY